MVAHGLLKKKKENGEENLLLKFFDFNYLKFTLTTELIFIASLFVLILCFRKRILGNDRWKVKEIFSFVLKTALKFTKFKKISLISTIIIFFFAFNSLNKQLISINIKTNKVIVDTREALS